MNARSFAWACVIFTATLAFAMGLSAIAHSAELPLSERLTSMMMRKAHPGLSPYSLEPLDSCGVDESAPTCDVTIATCAEPTVLCRAPVFVAGAWRQVERKATARARFSVIAKALADETEDTMLKSKGRAWPGNAEDFAVAMLAASYWSTGLREDIESGRKRGPANEACLADLQPMVAWKFAAFPHANMSAEQVALSMVGTDYGSLRRCFGAGLRALASMRRWADIHCRATVSASYSGFAAYGTGNSCSTVGSKFGDFAMLREHAYRSFRSQL